MTAHCIHSVRVENTLIPEFKNPVSVVITAVHRGKAVKSDVPAQHVGAVAGRSCPHVDDTIFRGTTKCDILGRRSGRQRDALPEAGVVEPLSRGEIVRVTMGSAGERSARR